MKKLAAVVVFLGLLVSLNAAPVSAGDHPLAGCKHCGIAHAQNWLSSLCPGCCCPHWPLKSGNCAFGPCGHGQVPGPWYTYWPYTPGNLSSPYQSPGWTYLHHFQTPAPLVGGGWPAPNGPPPGFGGVPYYWQGR